MKEDQNLEVAEEQKESSKLKKYGTIFVVAIVVVGMSAFGLIDFIGGGSDYIVKVDDKKVTPQAFSKFLDSQKKQYISRFGSGIIEVLLNKREFTIITANLMADGLLIAKALEEEGIVVNKDTAKYFILNNPMFKMEDGKFDKVFYTNYLAQMGISEEEYLTEQIGIIQTKFLTEILGINDYTQQEELVKKLIASKKQTRDILIKKVPIYQSASLGASEDEIMQYYIKNKEQFAEPEKKIVTIAKIDESSVSGIYISNEELVKEYNREYLYKNQKVSFYKLSFNTLDEAKFAESLIKKEGVAFTDVAKETLKLNPSDIYFKNLSFAELSPEFQNEVANLIKFEVSPVFYANGSYNILKIENVSSAGVPSFESVKSKIAAKLKRTNSCSIVQKRAEEIAADLDSGEELEKGLKNFNLERVTITEDTKSLLPDTLIASIKTDTDTYYGKVIQTKPCEYYAYHITKIEPVVFKPIEEVEGIIANEVKKNKAKSNAVITANSVMQKFKTSGFAEDERMNLKRTSESFASKEVIENIFKAEEGEILPPFLSSNEKEYIIVKIAKINRFDESKISPAEVDKALKEIRGNQKEELLRGFLLKQREKYNVKLNYFLLQGAS